MSLPGLQRLDREILARRGAKNRVDPRRPYAFFVEQEAAADGPPGRIERVATLFLTNRECPFRCLMCDLWKNTTDTTVPEGAVPEQIAWALERIPEPRQGIDVIKLYNSGNFFDRRAIPPADHAAIAELVAPFRTVVVENHPRLCNQDCLRFRDRIAGRLEVAMGLETAHPEVLERLNKRMTVEDFRLAAELLATNDVRVRVFLLLCPPFLDRRQGVEWTLRSLEVAFDAGAECCGLVPTRSGNGTMEVYEELGEVELPTRVEIEEAFVAGLEMRRGRVLLDLWDADRFLPCPRCRAVRKERWRQMSLQQRVLPPVVCPCDAEAGRGIG